MDYEKKYKEALELARDYYKANLKLHKADENAILEDIFPELVESEDERIRKKLISLMKNWDKEGIVSKYTSDANEIKLILAWLEKQGDKPFDYENANIQQKDFAPKSQRMMSAKAKEALYGKPTWSEEDEERFKETLAIIETVEDINKAKDCFLGAKMWLKSLKEKIGG